MQRIRATIRAGRAGGRLRNLLSRISADQPERHQNFRGNLRVPCRGNQRPAYAENQVLDKPVDELAKKPMEKLFKSGISAERGMNSKAPYVHFRRVPVFVYRGGCSRGNARVAARRIRCSSRTAYSPAVFCSVFLPYDLAGVLFWSPIKEPLFLKTE